MIYFAWRASFFLDQVWDILQAACKISEAHKGPIHGCVALLHHPAPGHGRSAQTPTLSWQNRVFNLACTGHLTEQHGGIPLLGHSSVYMVWTHIRNKAGQSRIILRKLHTFQVLPHMSPLSIDARQALELSERLPAAGTLQRLSLASPPKFLPAYVMFCTLLGIPDFPHQECQPNRKRDKLRELCIYSKQVTMNNKGLEGQKGQPGRGQPAVLWRIHQICQGLFTPVYIYVSIS